MSLKQLTEEQVRSFPIEAKDRWWLEHVYRGDTPQMTVRVVLLGFLLGGVLSITNLYVGAKIGASLGTSITAVVLAFMVFRGLSRLGLARNYNILEGTILQSIACSAGFMSSPLTASMAAFMVVTNAVIPAWQMILWLIGLSILGVLFAIPFKRRFINDTQSAFPEGRACGVVLEALHQEMNNDLAAAPGLTGSSSQNAMRPAKLLVFSAIAAGMVKLLQSSVLLEKLRLGFLAIPEVLDAWYYRIAARDDLWIPAISKISLRELTIRPTLDVAMIGVGGLIGIRTCFSLLVGAVINYFVLAPWMIHRGDIVSRVGPDGLLMVGFRAITTWSLWCGVALMTAASLWSFLADSRASLAGLRRAFARGQSKTDDPIGHIEIPLWVFCIATPLVATGMVIMANAFFGVQVWLAACTIPMVFVLTMIAVNATALTSITPHGALGKITQLACGVLAPRNITTNIAAAGLSAEVAFQASNVIQNMKPGYMLGARPRLQAIGHLIGAVAGALFGVGVFYNVFMKGQPFALVTEEYPFPAVVVWKAVAEALTGGLSGLATSALFGAAAGAVIGVLLEIARRRLGSRMPLSAVGMGLAFIIPFDISLAMFAGAFFFWFCGRIRPAPGKWLNDVVVANQDSICAGLVAGAAIVGIGASAVEAF